MIKLKPCPFCNGEAVYEEFARNGKTYGYIYCKDCKIGTPRFNILTHKGRFEAAEKRWNRRADDEKQ